MLQVTVLTLFPEMFAGVIGHSMIKRAIDAGKIRVELVNFRAFAVDRHKTVDDSPFGGGAGMLLKPAPLFDAIESFRPSDTDDSQFCTQRAQERIVLMSPQGRPFTHETAIEFSQASHLTLLCGHYEGVDERVRQHLVTDEISMGDYVLTGGEIPAMAVLDAVVRFLPGVLGNEASTESDSFASGLLEYPQYTRPATYRAWSVPETLLSGNHQHIEEWRHRHALYRTWARRPDLLQDYVLSALDKKWITQWEANDFSGLDVLESQHGACKSDALS